MIYLVTAVGLLPSSSGSLGLKYPFEERRCHFYPPKSSARIQYSRPQGTKPVFSGSLDQRRAWEDVTQQQTSASELFCKLLSADLCPRHSPQTQTQTGWQPRVNLLLLLGTSISRHLKEVGGNFLWVIST